MDFNKLGEELKDIPTDILVKLAAWITDQARNARAMTGGIMTATDIARLLTIEQTQRALVKEVVTGEGTGEPKGFLDIPTIPKQVTKE